MSNRVHISLETDEISIDDANGRTLGTVKVAAMFDHEIDVQGPSRAYVTVKGRPAGVVEGRRAHALLAEMRHAFVTRNGPAAVLWVNGMLAHFVPMSGDLNEIKQMAREHIARGHRVALKRAA